MNARRHALPAVAALALLFAGCGSDATPAVARLTVSDAWARSTPAGATNGVVYLTITSPTDDTLIGASVPADIAATAAMHETMGGGGTSPMPNMPDMTTPGAEMTMTPVASVALPAGEAIVFEPGGRHIMLTGLSGRLEAGDHFPLTLALSSGITTEVDVTVGDNPPSD